jgi:hypothetical protein
VLFLCRELARWLSRRDRVSVVSPSTVFRYLLTSPAHSLNPATYFVRTEGSFAMATATHKGNHVLSNQHTTFCKLV